jgi:hypothetical protein
MMRDTVAFIEAVLYQNYKSIVKRGAIVLALPQLTKSVDFI